MRGVLSLLIVLAAACHGSPTTPSVPVNAEFVLAPGSAAIVEGASLRVRFNGVTGDSRCPADAICVWGGDAVVGLTATSPSGARDLELHTGDMRPVVYDGLTIALVRLVPYPFSSQGPIPPDDYRVTLRATR